MSSSTSEESNEEALQWFESGVNAMNLEDWNSSVKCLSHAVRLKPDELEYREQKHRSCRRKFQKNGNVSKLSRVKLAAIRGRIRSANVREDWAALDQLAEDAIAIDPWDARTFAHIAEAAARVDRVEIAKYAWTSAVKIDGTNTAYLRSFGAVLQANGELEMAKSCFEKMRVIAPTSPIAEDLIRAIDIAALMEQRGFAKAKNSRDVAARQEEPRPAVDQRFDAFVTLAKHHTKRKEHEKTIEACKSALSIVPGDRSIQTRMEDAEVAFLRQQAMDARNAARQDPKCDRRRETATQLLTRLSSREIQIHSQWVQENPDNLLHTYYLADCYRRASQLETAICLFQKVCADPQLQTEARIAIGECRIRSDQAELGRQELEIALLEVDPAAQPRAFKLAHYWLGRLYETRKEYAKSVEHYGNITAVDSQFRDVARRLQVLNTITWP
ncbi:MAG TPA: hypothetical protein EYG03_24700 [Planctomycetes bacterium]|nr:hypothetical protein [Planctomycetota bacterium]